MLLEIHDHLGKPLKIHATRVLIRADNGTPVAFSLELGPTWVRHFRASDPGFLDQLRHHGLDRTAIVETTILDPSTLKPVTQ